LSEQEVKSSSVELLGTTCSHSMKRSGTYYWPDTGQAQITCKRSLVAFAVEFVVAMEDSEELAIVPRLTNEFNIGKLGESTGITNSPLVGLGIVNIGCIEN